MAGPAMAQFLDALSGRRLGDSPPTSKAQAKRMGAAMAARIRRRQTVARRPR